MDYENRPILITGAARSGTSMVAGCIHLCGAFKGNTGGPNKYNKKGMFENLALREQVIKRILEDMQVDRLGQYPLPNTEDVRIDFNIGERIKSIMRKEGWNGKSQWMWKCAKMSLVWPVWSYAFPDSKWVIVRRKRDDIITSCCKTGFMRKMGFPNIYKQVGAKDEREGWGWWVDFHIKKFNEIMEVGHNVKVIWPERMVKGDYSQMKDTIEWLGLKWNGEAVVDFIEPKLFNARRV